MVRQAMLAAIATVTLVCGLEASDLEVWIDIDGSAYLYNTTALPLSFTNYTLSSDANKLDPAGWKSIADQVVENPSAVISQLGASALLFGEASPGQSNLSELTISPPGATLQPFAKFAIGKPFINSAAWVDVTGTYLPAGSVTQQPMQVGLPEPSTFLLAVVAGLGLTAYRYRGTHG
jgi:hypothetical protein